MDTSILHKNQYKMKLDIFPLLLWLIISIETEKNSRYWTTKVDMQ